MVKAAKTKVYHYDLLVANRNKIAEQAHNINEGLHTLRLVTGAYESIPPPAMEDLKVVKAPVAAEVDEFLKQAIEAVEEELASAKKEHVPSSVGAKRASISSSLGAKKAPVPSA